MRGTIQFLSTLYSGYSPSPQSSGSAFQTTLRIAEVTHFDFDIYSFFFCDSAEKLLEYHEDSLSLWLF